MRRTPLRVLLLGLAASILTVAGAPVAGATTERASVSSAGEQGGGLSRMPAISADGRYVAFASSASNLVANDTNNAEDIFVRDRQTGATERVSVDGSGGQGNGGVFPSPAISSDGRYVAFISGASNLVAGDTNRRPDVFVRDRQGGGTERVNVGAGGGQANGPTHGKPAISGDGRYVAFYSEASNLVPGDTNAMPDVFVHDRETGGTELVSVGLDGAPAGGGAVALSADGRYVAFHSCASNLVASDSNNHCEVFVRDRREGSTERVATEDVGGKNFGYQQPAISADGRYVAFNSYASNLVPGDTTAGQDVFVHDRERDATERVSGEDGPAYGDFVDRLAISADGRYVTFASQASTLVAGDTNGSRDIFVRDRETDVIERVSYGAGGQTNSSSSYPSISADGRYVAFESGASNLVRGDTNRFADVFVRDRAARPATLTLIPWDDARTEEAQPERSFGPYSPRLRVDGAGDPDARSYLRFSVAGASGRITGAKLRLYAVDKTANGPAIYAASEDHGTFTSTWDEWGINWLNQPALTSGPGDDKRRIAADTWIEYDVSSLVRENGTHSFGLATDSSDGVNFSSAEGGNEPELVVTVAYD